MCRFNLILVTDEKGESILKQEGYDSFLAGIPNYKTYHKGYCDCGSFVGSLLHRKGMTYQDAIAAERKEKLEHLYQLRDLMNEPSYKEKLRDFQLKCDELREDCFKYQEEINEVVRIRQEEIQMQYSGDELIHQMNQLYKESEDLQISLGEKPENKEKLLLYQDFIMKNQLLNESTTYFLTKEDEKRAFQPDIPLAELLNIPDIPKAEIPEKEMVTIKVEPETRVIGDVIAKMEEETIDYRFVEYENYHNLFSNLLKYIPSIQFCSIWSEANNPRLTKTISIDNLKIDDIVFLDFDEIISIIR